MNWQDRYQSGRETERTLRPMTHDDLPGAVALTDSVGWGHQIADWERLFYWSQDGCFVLEEQDRGIIGTVTTTPYGTALAWIGMLVIAPDRQRRGFGRRLMRASLDYLIARGTERIMLDASAAGRPLYEGLGFRVVCMMERWEGKASTYLGARARPMRSDDVPAVLELDTQLFGLQRTFILMRLLEEFPDLAWVADRRGQVEGYLLGRRTQNGVYLGPWMSWTAAAAEQLLLIAFEQLQGEHITINTADYNGRALALARDHNLQRIRHCTRMIYGDASPPGRDMLAEISVASLATG
ncbi:MAG: GNAT family N-acetyltransferase [Anaerolineae bacterium]|nr:GNAT family N-acetyltransferase [Anaerolineae bacterium]